MDKFPIEVGFLKPNHLATTKYSPSSNLNEKHLDRRYLLFTLLKKKKNFIGIL